MKKKFSFLSSIVVLAVVTLCCLFALPTSTEAASVDDLSFAFNAQNKTYAVSLCNSDASGELEIPATYNGYPVTSVEGSVFSHCSGLTSVTIPDSVASIGTYAFYDCTGLTSVTIGDSVSSIGDYAFKNCTELTDVYITDPSAWCKITFGNYNANPMYYADSLHVMGTSGQELSKVYLNNTVTNIPSRAFRGCSTLAFIFIPDSVETIGGAAFANCTGLTSITIPDSVTGIGGSAFAGCSNLKEMILPFVGDGNGNYPLGWIFGQAIGNVSYSGFSKVTQKYIYSGTVYTGDFFIPDSLKSVTVTGRYIGYGAFSNCTGLTNIAMLTSDPEPYIYDGAFSGCSNLESLTLPNAPTDICRIFGSKSYSGSYKVLQHTACSDYSGSLKTYYLPRSLKNLTITNLTITRGRIGECAFEGCYMLENVVLGSSVYAIDAYAFYDCANLRSIFIPNISYCAFDAFRNPWGPNGEDDIQDVWYTGTLSDRKNIVYHTDGDKAWFLRNATWHYSTCAYGHTYSSSCDTTCSSCEWVRSTNIDHIYDNECDTDCNVCGDVRTVPHSFDNACDTDCNLCDYIRTIEHSYDHACDTDCNICYEVRSITHTYADATCTAPMTCQICGDTQGKALGHDMGQWETTKEATCMEAGGKRRDCSRCDHFETDVISATGHSHYTVVTDPTCTEQGYTTHTCHCGDTYVDTYVDALDHSFTDYKSNNNATCTADGTETAKCDRCEEIHTRTEEGSATGHSHDTVVTDPTCTEQGYTTHTCHCGDSYVDAYVSVLGHNWSSWKTTKKATCTANGTSRRECSRCQKAETKAITKTGHTYTKKVVASTYTKQGYTQYTCKCGYSYKNSYKNAKGLVAPSVKITSAKTGKPAISWKAVSEASNYTIYRATSKTGSYTKLKSVTTTSYTDSSATLGKTYYYKVIAVCASDSKLNSKASSIVSAVTKCGQPTIKIKQNSKKQPVISWGKVSGAKKYDVYYATAKNGTYKKLTSTTKTSYTHTKVSAGKEYYYQVRAYSTSTTTGAFSAVARSVVKLATPSLTVTAKNGQATIKWKKVTGATKYELQCSVSGGAYKTIATVSGTSYTHNGLAGGNKYTYRLQAKSSVSDAISAFSATKAVSIQCAAPTISVSLSGNKPVIKWSKVSGAAKYQVYYATSKSGKYKLVGTVTGTSFTHSGAPAAKACYYKVLAVDKNGTKGAYSSAKSITTKCAAPTAVKVKLNSKKQPVITWSKASGAKKYEVYVATSPNGTYKKLTSTSELTYTYTKAKTGTTYYFKVTAYGSSTSSRSSYSAIVKTP